MPLTITPSLEKEIDFTVSIMDAGKKILIKKPEPQFFLLQCFTPLDYTVWLMIIGMMVLVSLNLTCHHYVSFAEYSYRQLLLPVGSEDRADCLLSQQSLQRWMQDHREQIRAFNLSNSIWATISAFLQQGGDATPKSVAARLVTIMWWLACTIIVSTYTANLAAVLTVNTLKPGAYDRAWRSEINLL